MVNLPRWQIILVALVVLAGVIFAAPNLLLTREQATRMADEGSILPHQQLSLGQDLRGGVYLLDGVAVSPLVEQGRDNPQAGISAARTEVGQVDSADGLVGKSGRLQLPDRTEEGKSRMRVSE